MTNFRTTNELGSGTVAARVFPPLCLLAAIASVVIGWSSARNLETCWDEHVDRQIAIGLRHHPLVGEQPTLDGSQTRLPMYATALAYALTGRDDLATARAVSLLCAAVTILATAALGRRLFGPLAGALAAVLLAFSPYFLAYGRIAMTEGDVFFACFTTLAAWSFVRYARHPRPGTWLTAAILCAFAVGAKLYAVVPLVVLAIVAISEERSTRIDVSARMGDRYRDIRRLHRMLIASVMITLASAVLAWLGRNAAVAGHADWSRRLEGTAIVGWLILLALWCCTVVLIMRRRILASDRIARFLGLVVFAAVTFFVLMPVHLLAHGIAREILHDLVHGSAGTSAVHLTDHLRLYSGIVLIKLTVPLGVLTIAALVFAAARAPFAAKWRFCVLPVVAYIVALCCLPMRQSFYLMGIYPLLVILTAAFLVYIGRWLRQSSPRASIAWAVIVVVLLIHLGWRVRAAYPCYHLYGYDVVGDRWLGAESRGYRNLIQTPSDGVESLIRWCNTDPRVRPGSRVVSYLWEEGIIADVLPATPRYTFVPRGLSPDSETPPPPPSVARADFVLLHINNLLGYGDRPPDRPREAVFSAEFRPVFTVRRGPLEVAWVFSRQPTGG